MKKILTLIVFVMFGNLAVNAQDAPAQAKPSPISFEKDTYDFGNIKEGVIAEYDFKFTNNSAEPVVLTNVRPSCGCTTPDWPKEPIMPGKSSVIKVKYNSTGRPGAFHKSITVTTDKSDESKVLFIKGDVTPAPSMTTDPNQSPVRIAN